MRERLYWSSTFFLASCARSLASSLFFNNFIILSTISMISPGFTNKPVFSCSMISTAPPMRVAMTGTPLAPASIITRPNASWPTEGRTSKSRPDIIFGMSCLDPKNSTNLSIFSFFVSVLKSSWYSGLSFGGEPMIKILTLPNMRTTLAMACKKKE